MSASMLCVVGLNSCPSDIHFNGISRLGTHYLRLLASCTLLLSLVLRHTVALVDLFCQALCVLCFAAFACLYVVAFQAIESTLFYNTGPLLHPTTGSHTAVERNACDCGAAGYQRAKLAHVGDLSVQSRAARQCSPRACSHHCGAAGRS